MGFERTQLATKHLTPLQAPWAVMDKTPIFNPANNDYQDGRVVKALDLSSNGRKSSWVRTPLLVMVLVPLIFIISIEM